MNNKQAKHKEKVTLILAFKKFIEEKTDVAFYRMLIVMVTELFLIIMIVQAHNSINQISGTTSNGTEAPTATPANTLEPTARVIESPQNVSLKEDRPASFHAFASGATSATWYFIGPDGAPTIPASEINEIFGELSVTGADTDTITLANIPDELNGWQLQCAFGFNGQETLAYSNKTTIVVDPALSTPIPDPNLYSVWVSKSPTSDSTVEGGSLTFIAYAENETSITWNFINPDGETVPAANIRSRFPSMRVEGDGTDTLVLSRVPSKLNGWDVQCVFDGLNGPMYTDTAKITVYNAASGSSSQPATAHSASLPDGPVVGSGSVTSRQSGSLVLVADWKAVADSVNSVTVLVNCRLKCASIDSQELYMTITLGDQQLTFVAPAVYYTDNTWHYANLGAYTFKFWCNEQFEVPLSVTYPFNGIYNGETISSLTCWANLTIG